MSQTPPLPAKRLGRLQLFFASTKYSFHQAKTRLFDLLARFKVWEREVTDFQIPNTQYTVRYTGRSSRLCMLKPLLEATNAEHVRLDGLPSVSVYELPKANSLCVPACLTTVVPLNRSIDDIVATYAKSLRRALKKQLIRFAYQTVTDKTSVMHVDQTMLRPYATARKGSAAHHFTTEELLSMALGDFGRLDVLQENGESVGCHLGNSYVEKGKRYWHVNRFGYINQVFSDYKHLQEANSANLHLALMKAIENGYDYCDYGVSLARPGDGLLEWKRRRKGILKPYFADGCFYLVPPKGAKAQFFWDRPLFALEGNDIVLHLGIPGNVTSEDFLNRYKEMGYDGLAKVYLHAENTLEVDFQSSIECLYKDLQLHPQVMIK